MVKRSVRKDDDSEIHDLKRDRARLRIAYIQLYQQYLDLDASFHDRNGHHDDNDTQQRKDG